MEQLHKYSDPARKNCTYKKEGELFKLTRGIYETDKKLTVQYGKLDKIITLYVGDKDKGISNYEKKKQNIRSAKKNDVRKKNTQHDFSMRL